MSYRYSADEIKEAWGASPLIAKNQARNAIPKIEKEISDLKCELEVCRDILERELDSQLPEPPRDEGKQQEYARGDEDDSGGIGSQTDETVRAEA